MSINFNNVPRNFPKNIQLSPMEPAFVQCGPPIIPLALGPTSKVIGKCLQMHGDGACYGTFHGKDVYAWDTPTGCVNDENVNSQLVYAPWQDHKHHATQTGEPSGHLKSVNGYGASFQPSTQWNPLTGTAANYALFTAHQNRTGNTILGNGIQPHGEVLHEWSI